MGVEQVQDAAQDGVERFDRLARLFGPDIGDRARRGRRH
jgi:hypothetical protein